AGELGELPHAVAMLLAKRAQPVTDRHLYLAERIRRRSGARARLRAHARSRRRQSRRLRSFPASPSAKPTATLLPGSVEPTPGVSSVEPTLMPVLSAVASRGDHP